MALAVYMPIDNFTGIVYNLYYMHILITLNPDGNNYKGRVLKKYYGELWRLLTAWGLKHTNKGGYFSMPDDNTAVVRFDDERNYTWFLMTLEDDGRFLTKLIEDNEHISS